MENKFIILRLSLTKESIYLFIQYSFSSEFIHSVIEYTHLYLTMQTKPKRIVGLKRGFIELTVHLSKSSLLPLLGFESLLSFPNTSRGSTKITETVVIELCLEGKTRCDVN